MLRRLAVLARAAASDELVVGRHHRPGASAGGTRSPIVGYSVAREVYADLIPAFQATPAGAGRRRSSSPTAASGEQSRAVAAGLAADFVAFSLEPDITRLVDAGLVDADWNAGAEQGLRQQLGRRLRRPARATPRASRPGTT